MTRTNDAQSAERPASIPFVTLSVFARAAGSCSVAIEPILRKVGLATQALHPETTTISMDALAQLMNLCTAQAATDGQHFPLVLGDSFAFEYLSDLEMFMTTSPTLRSALRVFEWLRVFINPYMHVHLDEGEQDALLVISFSGPGRPPEAVRYFVEAFFAGMLKFAGLMIDDAKPVQELRFAHSAPRYAAIYESFFEAPVHCGCPESAVVFKAALLDQPLRAAFPLLNQQAEQRVQSRLASWNRPAELAAEIEQAFAECPALLGLGMEVMAQRLTMSPRTLQRRLQDEGQSYSTVQNKVRLRLAERWLHEGRLSIEDIGERLGFADRRGFTQAFTRWSGRPPSRFKRTPTAS
ncbi:MAG: AraC family transcriptional regulator [Rubrivivax sp.]|nr:MAG: AraC family transcriptional regulator [Rubrivivax sp.]